MAKRTILGRRAFLQLAATATATIALGACTQPSAPAPTAGAKPAVAPTRPAPAPTTPPVVPSATSLPQATAAPAAATAVPAAPTRAPVAAPTTAPAATTVPKPAERKIGATLMGKIESPEVITDLSKYPKIFKEAPMLAELVKAGKLPPLPERLPVPEDVLVLKPVHEIGKYGGTLRRGFTGPGDKWNGYRIAGRDVIVYVDYTGTKAVPNIVKSWEFADGGRTTIFHLRRGMKWSDGHPFTAEDFRFWYEDMYRNKDLVPTPTDVMAINGKQGTLEQVDDYTIRFKFADPYLMFPYLLAFNTPLGGQSVNGLLGMGGFAPAHYLKQFHAKYTPKDELDKKAKDAKFDNWVSLFKARNDWAINVELPVVTAWKTTAPANTPTWVLERNPYYYQVDTEGNQLPYIDKSMMTLAENLEVINLRAIAGEFDFQQRHVDIRKVPVFLENQQKMNYKIHLDPMESGSDYGIWFNLDYQGDPALAKLFNDKDFRHALSLGIDREQINEVFFLGIGIAGSAVPADVNPYNPGPAYRTLWSTYDPKKANELLDKIGLDKKDAEGFRLRPDGKERLRVQMPARSATFLDYIGITEMVREHWRKIGIDASTQEIEWGLYQKRLLANEIQIFPGSNTGSDAPFSYPFNMFPIDATILTCMPEYGRWFASAGAQGREPPPAMRQIMEMYRKGMSLADEERFKLGKEMWKIMSEELWYIGVVGQSGADNGVRVVKNTMGNVPERQTNVNPLNPPAISRPHSFYFKS